MEANIPFLQVIQTIYYRITGFFDKFFVSRNIFSSVNIISNFYFNILIDI